MHCDSYVYGASQSQVQCDTCGTHMWPACMSIALKMQCFMWTHKARVYDFMSVHTV